MLASKYKLKRKDFSSVFSRGKIFHSTLFTLRVFFGKEQGATPSRFSFVASAKVSKKATERNTFKRRGYAIIQKHKTKISSGYLCAFFLKKESAAAPFKELEKEIITVLKRANVFCV